MSLCSAVDSRTSSLRSVAMASIASTGGSRLRLRATAGAILPRDSESPVAIASSLPMATMSPASARRALAVVLSRCRCRMPDTRPDPPDEHCSVAPSSKAPREQTRQRQLAAVLRMHVLNTKPAGSFLQTRRGVCAFRHAGRLMPQRLHQPADAVVARGGADQHRADQALAQFAGEIVEHRSRGGSMSARSCSISASS